ncbi:MAG: hypothetical protein JNN28_20585 [Saprospiraceae bacterium]|nr:hypothetical protein [Saprospiraceae bacterium]
MKPLFILFLNLFSLWAAAQQVSDTAFNYPNPTPRRPSGSGSVVMVDAAHGNFHTLEGRYAPFGKVLTGDGFRVVSNTARLDEAVLKTCRILVVSNALDTSNLGGRWLLPNPSAFSDSEIKTIHQWVKNGGRLLLIADHMPFAGASQALAASFGFEYLNCFAMDNRSRTLERFYKSNQTLADDLMTAGIDTIVTFTGSAFRMPKSAKPILKLNNYTLLSPRVAWQFEEDTSAKSSEGYYQGAYMPYGKGKLVMMGEAAMFTAQLSGPNRAPTGLNVPAARQNGQLLLNLIRWLDDER